MEHNHEHQKKPNHYLNLAVMAVLSFIAMYILMYSMADSISNVYMSLNQVYMAALMAAPMVAIELIVMRMMYADPRLNKILLATSLVVGVAMFLFIREQTAIGDRQFVRSMIPHHSGAILMCEKANVRDAELRQLCQGIITSQQREINQMTAMLNRLP